MSNSVIVRFVSQPQIDRWTQWMIFLATTCSNLLEKSLEQLLLVGAYNAQVSQRKCSLSQPTFCPAHARLVYKTYAVKCPWRQKGTLESDCFWLNTGAGNALESLSSEIRVLASVSAWVTRVSSCVYRSSTYCVCFCNAISRGYVRWLLRYILKSPLILGDSLLTHLIISTNRSSKSFFRGHKFQIKKTTSIS